MWVRCASTVRGETKSSSAICRLVRPCATRSATWRSAAVSASRTDGAREAGRVNTAVDQRDGVVGELGAVDPLLGRPAAPGPRRSRRSSPSAPPCGACAARRLRRPGAAPRGGRAPAPPLRGRRARRRHAAAAAWCDSASRAVRYVVVAWSRSPRPTSARPSSSRASTPSRPSRAESASATTSAASPAACRVSPRDEQVAPVLREDGEAYGPRQRLADDLRRAATSGRGRAAASRPAARPGPRRARGPPAPPRGRRPRPRRSDPARARCGPGRCGRRGRSSARRG